MTPIPNFFHLNSNHYWLRNAHVPLGLLVQPAAELTTTQTRDGLVAIDLEIERGLIRQIVPAGRSPAPHPALDLKLGMVWSCFVDLHTHLDKGHTWERAPNRSGTFDEALHTVKSDSQAYWSAEDVYRRMEFGLKCSYAHGTSAIRTHLDSYGEQAEISFGVFKQLQAEWRDRLTLQASCLVSLDYFLTPAGEVLADLVAEAGGVLGAVAYMSNHLDAQLDRFFTLAQARQLPVDIHADETGNPHSRCLLAIAQAAIRHQFTQPIVCGHCCSLSVQAPEEVAETLDWVKRAGIGIVSLPMCNLFLQDRAQMASQSLLHAVTVASDRPLQFPSYTPRWRGVTLVHELHHAGIPVAVASDNCRDPFYGFGDHDGLEVFTQATRIAHFDAPYDNWCRTVTTTPADLMRLPTAGRIGVGLPADLVVFRARFFSELLSRRQSDRLVLRHGQPIDTQLPDYSELDDLVRIGSFD